MSGEYSPQLDSPGRFAKDQKSRSRSPTSAILIHLVQNHKADRVHALGRQFRTRVVHINLVRAQGRLRLEEVRRAHVHTLLDRMVHETVDTVINYNLAWDLLLLEHLEKVHLVNLGRAVLVMDRDPVADQEDPGHAVGQGVDQHPGADQGVTRIDPGVILEAGPIVRQYIPEAKVAHDPEVDPATEVALVVEVGREDLVVVLAPVRELAVEVASRSGSRSGSDDAVTIKKLKKKGKNKKAGRISDASENEGEKELVAEIFGDSGDEGEGAKRKLENDENLAQDEKSTSKTKPDDSSDDDRPTPGGGSHMSDFDLMMARKKAERTGRKKRRDVDIINDTDDMIVEFLREMKLKAEEDRELNKKKQAATKKLMYLNFVLPHLKKVDLKMSFLDQGILNVICDWLSPLPDKSLPHLSIREEMLRLLEEFPGEALDQSMLKSSGIEERESKDYERFQAVKRAEAADRDQLAGSSKKRKKNAALDETSTAKPGEPGFVARARVPMPSIKDYVVRPKWNVDTEFSMKNAEKKKTSRLDKHVRAFQERKRRSKGQRSVTISIEGRKMAI
ncbi:protein IWS1-like [Tropilaelaps mercedesae]|uniref:Protein IWS1-like n=1 Tax=Tropilaelaps mercedesae TaxID=418985 RepID=A0A1V9XJX6_9ACAR|nr:protein IWS1-like [Tropilaelaps mercedesae]